MKTEKPLPEIIERLYRVNALISLRFVTGLQRPRQKDMEELNAALGAIIKELREANEEITITMQELREATQ